MAYLKIRSLGLALIGLASVGFGSIDLGSMISAHAQASIGDCEKIQAADAYNQCLARFGPTSKVKSLQPERPGDVKESSEEAAAGAGRSRSATSGVARSGAGSRKATASRRGRRGRVARHVGGGRKRMVISVRRRRR